MSKPITGKLSLWSYWQEKFDTIWLKLLVCVALFITFLLLEYQITLYVAAMEVALRALNQASFWWYAFYATVGCAINYYVVFVFNKRLVKIKRAWRIFLTTRIFCHEHFLAMLANPSNRSKVEDWFLTLTRSIGQFTANAIDVSFEVLKSLGKVFIYSYLLWCIPVTYSFGFFDLPHALLFLTLGYSLLINTVGGWLQYLGQNKVNASYGEESKFRSTLDQEAMQASSILQNARGKPSFYKRGFESFRKFVSAGIRAFDQFLHYRLFSFNFATALVTVVPWLILAPAIFSGQLQLALCVITYSRNWYKIHYSLKVICDKLISFFCSKSNVARIKSLHDDLASEPAPVPVTTTMQQGRASVRFDFIGPNMKQYQGKITFEKGQDLRLSGDNGSGKSTLIRALKQALMQQQEDKGEGVRITGLANIWVFPQQVIQKTGTVWAYLHDAYVSEPKEENQKAAENLLRWIEREVEVGADKLWPDLHPVEDAKYDAWLDKQLTRLGLLAKKDQPSNTLSGGELRQLAFIDYLGAVTRLKAKSDAQLPDLFVLDEMDAEISAQKQIIMKKMLQEVRGEYDCALWIGHSNTINNPLASEALRARCTPVLSASYAVSYSKEHDLLIKDAKLNVPTFTNQKELNAAIKHLVAYLHANPVEGCRVQMDGAFQDATAQQRVAIERALNGSAIQWSMPEVSMKDFVKEINSPVV